MSWTKKQLIEQAHVELGLSSYAYNLQPRQLQDAMIKMDGMVSGWETSGIYIGYPIPTTILGGDLDQDTTIDVRANEAIYLNLAIRLAPSFGKQITNETRVSAKTAFNRLLNRATIAPELAHADNSFAGAGNKRRTYLPNVDITVARSKDEIDIT